MNDLWGRRFACLDALPLDLATVLRKCGVQELPIEQVASALQLPVGTAKTRLRKARALWRDAWRKHGL